MRHNNDFSLYHLSDFGYQEGTQRSNLTVLKAITEVNHQSGWLVLGWGTNQYILSKKQVTKKKSSYKLCSVNALVVALE